MSEAEAAALKEQSKLAGQEGLTRIMEVLTEAEMRLRDAASKKILIEVALLKAIEARSAISIDSLLKQLQNLRDGKADEAAGVPAPTATASPRPARAVAAAVTPAPAPRAHTTATAPVPAQTEVAPASAPTEDLAELWVRLLEAVGRASPFTRTYLLEAHPVSFQKNLLIIGFDPEFEDHIGLVDNARNHTLLQTKLLELGRPNAQIKFIKSAAPEKRAATPAEPPPPATEAPPKPSPAAKPAAAPAKEKLASVPFNKEDFKKDPLIQKALEIFKGQIVEARA